MGDHRAGRVILRGLIGCLLVIFLTAGCTIAGSAVIAPYRSRPLAAMVAKPLLAKGANVLALAPDGALEAVADPVHGVCLRSTFTNAAPVCADVALTGKPSISADFSPDGQTVALGRDVSARGSGTVWLIDVRTGRTRAVPASGSAYIGMVWNPAGGHLLLISNSTESDGPRTRVVDVDPDSLIPRVVALATSPYEFQSGHLASGGSKVIFTVYLGDQIRPNLVVIDLVTGVRKVFAPLGPSGTSIVPLAVSPDGKQAVVGSATYGPTGPPRLLDLASGRLTDIGGLTGNFVTAAYSPNGAQLAVVSAVDAHSARIEIASVSGGRARTVTETPAAVAAGSTLTWSGLDVVSVSSTPSAAGALVGWALSG